MKSKKKVRKYRVALTEAQISRALAFAQYMIDAGDKSLTTESLKHNLRCVYEKIVSVEEAVSKECPASGEAGADLSLKVPKYPDQPNSSIQQPIWTKEDEEFLTALFGE
jgi:hypothetical protein